MSAGFPAAGANDTGEEVTLCADVADMAVLVLEERVGILYYNVRAPKGPSPHLIYTEKHGILILNI